MDHREVAGLTHNWYKSIDERRMMAKVDICREEEETGEEIEEEIEVSFSWVICPTCKGSGKHVNPSIDAHGISQEEFDMDPTFAEDYANGFYDVTCYGCKGRRVIAMPDGETENGRLAIEKMEEKRRWAADEARAIRMGY